MERCYSKKKDHFLVCVNSAFRDKTVFPNPNKFTIVLPKILKNVRSVRVRNFYCYSNEAEYLFVVLKQFNSYNLTSPVEGVWKIPSNVVSVVETLANRTLSDADGGNTGRRYMFSETDLLLYEKTSVGNIKQLDIEIYGRQIPDSAIILSEPTPITLFPFTVPGHEWSAVFDFECAMPFENN